MPPAPPPRPLPPVTPGDPGHSDRSALRRQPLAIRYIRQCAARTPSGMLKTSRSKPTCVVRPFHRGRADSGDRGQQARRKTTAKDVIIAAFDTRNQAYDAANDINRLSQDGGVDVKSGAIIEKDPLGNVSALDSQDLPTAWGPGGAAGGALVGALVACSPVPVARLPAPRRARPRPFGRGGRRHRRRGDRLAGGLKLGPEGRLSGHGRDLFGAGQDGRGRRGRGRLDRADRRGGATPWRHRLPRGGHGLTRRRHDGKPRRGASRRTRSPDHDVVRATPALRNGGTTAWIPARRINWLAPGSG